MKMRNSDYIFTTERLGFRNWKASDLDQMAHLNADPEVMKYFPSTVDRSHTKAYIERMQKQFDEKQYCYFAVERLDQKVFIGFIGLSYQTYDAPFTPCVDIGWRLAQEHWGKGFATEGAKACLNYAFNDMGIKTIFSVASIANKPSTNVMKKIGMVYDQSFDHPALVDTPELNPCVVYKISKD